MADRLDVIIFGATGFTGKQTVVKSVRLLEGLKWGVAGRSEKKIKDVLDDVGKKVEKDLASLPYFVADVADENSLQDLMKRTKV